MTTIIIITICCMLLLAYLFDLTSSKSKIPSVVLFLLLGWLMKQGTSFLELTLPDFSILLPIMGTLGLILIVLEGSLELEFNRSKTSLIKKSFLEAFLPMIVLAFLFSAVLYYLNATPIEIGLLNVIPLCIISSAIAIPTVKKQSKYYKDFVIYESSFSDILGVLFFNFVANNDHFGWLSVGNFILEIILIAVISLVAILALSFLMNKIEHHIKFIPIILLVILIYSITKLFHLPSLIFILLFGLFLGNLDEMKNVKWINKLNPENLKKEVKKFKELAAEFTFLIRALFFLLFGFLLETNQVLNTDTILWAILIVVFIFLVRALFLKLLKLQLSPLVYIAPRGLITILLFISIDPVKSIPIINKSLIIQVILLSVFYMMFGIFKTKKE